MGASSRSPLMAVSLLRSQAASPRLASKWNTSVEVPPMSKPRIGSAPNPAALRHLHGPHHPPGRPGEDRVLGLQQHGAIAGPRRRSSPAAGWRPPGPPAPGRDRRRARAAAPPPPRRCRCGAPAGAGGSPGGRAPPRRIPWPARKAPRARSWRGWRPLCSRATAQLRKPSAQACARACSRSPSRPQGLQLLPSAASRPPTSITRTGRGSGRWI